MPVQTRSQTRSQDQTRNQPKPAVAFRSIIQTRSQKKFEEELVKIQAFSQSVKPLTNSNVSFEFVKGRISPIVWNDAHLGRPISNLRWYKEQLAHICKISDISKNYEKYGEITEKEFIDVTKYMINQVETAIKTDNKIKASTKLIKFNIKHLPKILRNNPNRFTKYSFITYNKSYEFEYMTDYVKLNVNNSTALDFVTLNRKWRMYLLDLFEELNISVKFNNDDTSVLDTGSIVV